MLYASSSLQGDFVMTLSRRDPWSMINRLQEDLQRLMPYRTSVVDDADGSNIATSRWTPPVDILEEDSRFVILADIPGVAPESIEVTMEDGVLTLKGERGDAAGEARDGARRLERISGAFHRRFALPDGIDADAVTAQGKHGVLEISIPKLEKSRQRRITVQ
jgi:HSP20 family protein